jgi:hypothetical protein
VGILWTAPHGSDLSVPEEAHPKRKGQDREDRQGRQGEVPPDQDRPQEGDGPGR